MIISCGVPEMADVDLISDLPAMLGPASPAEDREGGRLRAGTIFAMPLSSKTVSDEGLASFIEAQAGSFDYHLLRTVCTFIDTDKQRFESAWIKVSLSRPDGESDPDQLPVAWSLEPERLTQPSGIVRDIEISASLKLVTGKMSSTGPVPEATYLQGKFGASSRPTWYLKRVSGRAIDGDVDLRIVARIAGGVQGCAEVSIGAAVRRKLGRTVPYVADLASQPAARSQVFGG